jgi:glyoxylase-like metal-dependent hydrolase (beta-lactamase superfamily II)
MSKEYFSISQIDNGIYHIFDPAITKVGCTLILGKEKALLFDTCYGIGDLKTTIRTITDLPIIAVNSHGHIDHIGGNWQFDEVYIHNDDISLAEQHSSKQIREQIITSFKEQSAPPHFSIDEFIKRETVPFIPVKEGQIFEIGQRELEVLHTPGHSQGCISLLDKKTGTLLSADIIMPLIWMFLPESTSIKTLVSSLKKLKDLSFDKIVSSHFQNTFPKDFIDRLILCANNIDVNKSKPFNTPFISQEVQKGALIYADGGEPFVSSDFVSIVFNESKL